MKPFVTKLSIAALSAIVAVPAHATDLVRLEIHEPAGGPGKPLDMRFQETARDDDASTVEVVFVSGASVPSSMFVMRGMCAVARARERTSFTSLPVDGSAGRYRVTFPTPRDGPTIEVPAIGRRPAQRMSAVVTLEVRAGRFLIDGPRASDVRTSIMTGFAIGP